ncbi:putative membrane protein [Sphingobium herbicidovorans NBRC 16415]|uniref:Membrane protein n=1 Tax=Sphingobium herbicidovorans (strain ATCC 700291 / DSM 11019 / CCUG 56400 / KCTC 2939 / LMG 18315 / NBRC 16415 / MH) TaxID=1219045 RepID=A0A086P7V2_SPHHM|nr:DUF2254 domain-containing protein [Sphingobium herbicidovorans]KFG89470.1 putative membrane protein [Sphingobium herbicidovorans NBRC 16415]
MSEPVEKAARMSSRWRWLMRLLFRRIWFRAALFSLSSVMLALLAAFIAPFIPYEISTKIGSDAVDNILGILASSMLAVTTFSLTAMVSAFSAASGTITPRATQLLVEDPTAQNALSTFIGAFLFSIVGICALSTGIYGTSGRVILFAGTILVIAIIVITLLRWIGHLSSFGRVGDTIDRLEKVTQAAIDRSGYMVTVLPAAGPNTRGRCSVHSDKIGYITHIDLKALDEIAEQLGCAIDLTVTPGAFVTPEREIAWLDRGDDKSASAIRDAFTFDHHRQFDHDPRLGLIVLSEIASRALSPAVNDPGTGTGIAVLGAGVRVMAALLIEDRDGGVGSAHVTLPAIRIEDLLDDLFRPIARDGAGVVEVAIKLQRSLAEIAAIAPAAHGLLAVRAADALARSQTAMTSAADLECVRGVYRSYWTGRSPDTGATRSPLKDDE